MPWRNKSQFHYSSAHSVALHTSTSSCLLKANANALAGLAQHSMKPQSSTHQQTHHHSGALLLSSHTHTSAAAAAYAQDAHACRAQDTHSADHTPSQRHTNVLTPTPAQLLLLAINC
jgi:hypothetical protein